MVWAGINNNRKTNLVIINGNLNAQRYRDEKLALVVIFVCERQSKREFPTEQCTSTHSATDEAVSAGEQRRCHGMAVEIPRPFSFRAGMGPAWPTCMSTSCSAADATPAPACTSARMEQHPNECD